MKQQIEVKLVLRTKQPTTTKIALAAIFFAQKWLLRCKLKLRLIGSMVMMMGVNMSGCMTN
ncbi:Uncharacterised protein [Vibrio cholerae]|nr:Uncharacterised protein [Vibrio cholerae]